MQKAQNFFIREATTGDSQQILDCLRDAFEPYRASYTDMAFADTVLSPETLARRFSEMQILVLVAVDGAHRIIGTISYRVLNEEGHIRGMAVRPEDQGTGVAPALLAKAESALRRLHCRAVTH